MDETCTVYKTVDFIAKKWSLIILLEIFKGKNHTKRYSGLKNKIENITPKMLSTRLKELEKEGLISKRIDTSEFPVKCEYTLTKSGVDFINVIQGIKRWALNWKNHEQICERTECKNCKL